MSSTPQKLSLKTINLIHTLCICCCENIQGENAKCRRYANGFKEDILSLDRDYSVLFKTGAPVNLWVCKECVKKLKLYHQSMHKRDALTLDIQRQVAQFVERFALFKTRYLKTTRGSKESPCMRPEKHLKSLSVTSNGSPSKIPMPINPVGAMPSPTSSKFRVTSDSTQPTSARRLFSQPVS